MCNSFRPRVLNDKLCYEVDVNEMIDKSVVQKELKIGLMFMIDHNEDRQVFSTEEQNDHDYLHQLGKYNKHKCTRCSWFQRCPSP